MFLVSVLKSVYKLFQKKVSNCFSILNDGLKSIKKPSILLIVSTINELVVLSFFINFVYFRYTTFTLLKIKH